MSLFQITYNTDKDRIELTARVFLDDLEDALEQEYENDEVFLATSEEHPDVNRLLEAYFNEKLNFIINKKEVQWRFLSKDYEADMVTCYLKIDYSKKIKTLHIKNDFLTEVFEDQKNIIHLVYGSNKKSFLFTNTEVETTLTFE